MADDSAASRLAALRQHPEVRLRLNEVLWYGKNLGLPTGTVCEGGRTWRETFDSEVDALLSAVAAAATDQALETARDHLKVHRATLLDLKLDDEAGGICDAINIVRDVQRDLQRVRALAGGAPPATQTTDTTEE